MTQQEPDRRQSLTGRAYCSECRSSMLRMGPNFICPTRVNPSRNSCADNSIDSSRLLRLIATHIVATVMTQPVIDRLTGLIQRDAEETSRRYQEHHNQTERSLEDLHRQQAALLSMQDRPGGDTPEVEAQLTDISNKRTALSYEARNARREIETQSFISDEARIEANARDVDTFLDEVAPEDTIEFIDNFVRSVGIGPWSVQLNYKFPIPSQEYPEGKLTYSIPRRGSDQTGVIGTPDEPPQTPATPFPTGINDDRL